MAEPITWRSIRGPSLAEASRPLEAAQQSITGAFDKFASMLREREAVNQGVLDRDNEAKVQTFLDRLQGATTPDQVAAMRSTGELDALRAALNPADRARVRGAEEARTTTLRQGIVAENAFKDQIQARQRAPLINEAKMFVANNDRAGLQSFLAKHDLGDEATFLTQLNAAEQAKTEFGWKEGNQKHVEALRPLDLQSKRMSIAASQEQVASAKETRGLATKQRERLEAAALIAAREQAMREDGNPYALDGVYSSARSEEAIKMMVDNGIGDSSDARGAMLKKVEELAEKNGPLPMSAVKQALLGASGGLYFKTDAAYASSVETQLNAALERQRTVQLANGKSGEANSLAAYHKQWVENRKAALDNPAPVTSKKR